MWYASDELNTHVHTPRHTHTITRTLHSWTCWLGRRRVLRQTTRAGRQMILKKVKKFAQSSSTPAVKKRQSSAAVPRARNLASCANGFLIPQNRQSKVHCHVSEDVPLCRSVSFTAPLKPDCLQEALAIRGVFCDACFAKLDKKCQDFVVKTIELGTSAPSSSASSAFPAQVAMAGVRP